MRSIVVKLKYSFIINHHGNVVNNNNNNNNNKNNNNNNHHHHIIIIIKFSKLYQTCTIMVNGNKKERNKNCPCSLLMHKLYV